MACTCAGELKLLRFTACTHCYCNAGGLAGLCVKRVRKSVKVMGDESVGAGMAEYALFHLWRGSKAKAKQTTRSRIGHKTLLLALTRLVERRKAQAQHRPVFFSITRLNLHTRLASPCCRTPYCTLYSLWADREGTFLEASRCCCYPQPDRPTD